MPRTSFPPTQLQKFNVNGKIENFLRCQLSFLSHFTLLISSSTQSNSLRECYKTKIIPSSFVDDIADDLVWIEQRNKWNWSILCIHSCRFWSSHSVQGGRDRPVLSARCTLTSCLTVWWNSFIKGRLFQIIRIQDGPQAILWQEVPPKQVNLSSFLSFVNFLKSKPHKNCVAQGCHISFASNQNSPWRSQPQSVQVAYFLLLLFCKRMTLFYGYIILCLTKITRKYKSQRSTLERACAPFQEIAGEPFTAFISLPDPWLINVAGDHPRPPHRGRVHLHPEIYRPAARCRKSPWRFNAMIFLIFFLAKYMGQHWWGR